MDKKNEVSLAGVMVVRYEETPISKKEGYDLPRYNVWAETADGSKKIIVKDTVEDYAVFIAQRLNEQLALDADADLDTNIDVSHLTDDDSDYEIEDDDMINAVIQTSNERRRR